MRTILACCIAALLTGCVTQEQIAARRAYEAQQQEAANQAYTQHLSSQCRSIGYQDDTDAFRNCLLTLHTQNQQNAAQMRGIALQQYLQQQQAPAYRSYRAPAPSYTNCSRDPWGNVTCAGR